MVRQFDTRSGGADRGKAFGKRRSGDRIPDLTQEEQAFALTDLTLACLDEYAVGGKGLLFERLHALLVSLRPQTMELTPKALGMLRELDPRIEYSLRVGSLDELERYRGFERYAVEATSLAGCRRIPQSVIAQVRVADAGELPKLILPQKVRRLRITGLDRFALTCSRELAERVDGYAPEICLCPENGAHLATASAVAYLESGGGCVAASFGGLGNKACLEEILLTQWVCGSRDNANAYTALPEIRDLVERITGRPFPRAKPVIGRSIFAVESGVHVDGLMKDSRLYEPFPPELVGQARAIIIGKHSGKGAVLAALSQAGLWAAGYDADAILASAKERSLAQGRGLSQEEFVRLCERHRREEVL